jgi:hypothetical protein
VASLWHDSPCHKACYWNEIDDLRALLEGDSGGDDDADTTRLLLVNAAGRDGWTALHTASFLNRLEAAELLLRAGAAVGSVTVSGQLTALHLACQRGHGDMAALLLRFMKGRKKEEEDGVAVDVALSSKRRYDKTTLHFLAWNGKKVK